MDSKYARDWLSWLPAANIAFARVLQAKDIKKYQPTHQELTDMYMFPLGNDDVAMKILVSMILR